MNQMMILSYDLLLKTSNDDNIEYHDNDDNEDAGKEGCLLWCEVRVNNFLSRPKVGKHHFHNFLTDQDDHGDYIYDHYYQDD